MFFVDTGGGTLRYIIIALATSLRRIVFRRFLFGMPKHKSLILTMSNRYYYYCFKWFVYITSCSLWYVHFNFKITGGEVLLLKTILQETPTWWPLHSIQEELCHCRHYWPGNPTWFAYVLALSSLSLSSSISSSSSSWSSSSSLRSASLMFYTYYTSFFSPFLDIYYDLYNCLLLCYFLFCFSVVVSTVTAFITCVLLYYFINCCLSQLWCLLHFLWLLRS